MVNEEEAEVVRDIFSMYAKGMTTSEIARHLHKPGVPTKRNGIWSNNLVRGILTNKTYCGKGHYGELEMPYPKIIDEQQIQTRTIRRTSLGAPAKHHYLLKGLGKCGYCGGSLLMHTVRRGRYLHCGRQHNTPHAHNCFTPRHRDLTLIEDFVWSEVIEFLTNVRKGDIYGVLLDNYEDSKGHRDTQIARANSELERLNRERQRLLSAMTKGWFTEEETDMEYRRIAEQKEHWETELANQTAMNNEVDWDSFWADKKAIDSLYDWSLMAATPEQKKNIIASVVKEFALYDNTIEIRYRIPATAEHVAEIVSERTTESTH